VTKTPEIDALAKQITTKLADMVGSAQAVEMLLGFLPTDHERLIRALRLFIDGGKRGISDAEPWLGKLYISGLEVPGTGTTRKARQPRSYVSGY
jgi:putative ATP-dependent endonuclease of OLD family